MEWTKDKIDYLKEHYPGGDVKELADYFGVAVGTLRQKAHRLNISNKRYFTEEEKERLDRYLGHYSYSKIARLMGKSYDCIKSYAYKNNMQTPYAKGDLCLAEVSRLVGRDKETIKDTWIKHGLVINKVGKHSMINPDNLFDVMKNNPWIYDATKCDQYYFMRFDWFDEKRKEDREKMINKRWEGWY